MKITIIAILISCTLISQNLYAGPKELFGEVKIEEFNEKSSGSYSEQQQAALNFVQAVESSQLAGNAQGDLTANSKASFYLTGLYLYCLQKSGACPFALDTVLVSDYFLNKQNKQGCANMKNLWRTWVENGYEKRVAYLIPLALSQKFTDFQQNKRPYYLKCEETLKSFTPDESSLKSIRTTKKFIEQIKEKGINIFIESGALKSAEDKSR